MDKQPLPCDTCPTNVKVICQYSIIRCKETDCTAYIAWRDGTVSEHPLATIYPGITISK